MLLINVYFPCYKPGPEYDADLGVCIGFIDNLLKSECYNDVIITADFNFPCELNNRGFSALNNVCAGYNIVNCDNFVTRNQFTYVNDALGHSSIIDHFFISNNMRHFIYNADLLQCINNFSDHNPIYIVFNMFFSADQCRTRSAINRTLYPVRWDRANLSDYYELTRLYLSDLQLDRNCVSCILGCNNCDHRT